MRRLSAVALALLALWLTACAASVPASDISDPQEDSMPPLPQAMFIYAGSLAGGPQLPMCMVFTTAGALQAYAAENAEWLGAEPGGAVSEALAGYDETFFAAEALLLGVLDEGSGSIRHELQSLTERDGTLVLTVKSLLPVDENGEEAAGTADMARWLVLVPIATADAALPARLELV